MNHLKKKITVEHHYHLTKKTAKQNERNQFGGNQIWGMNFEVGKFGRAFRETFWGGIFGKTKLGANFWGSKGGEFPWW